MSILNAFTFQKSLRLAMLALLLALGSFAPQAADAGEWLANTNILQEEKKAEDENKNALPNLKKTRPGEFRNAVLIEFKGEINHKLFKYFQGRFQKAKRRKADLLIIEIHSPGGYLVESLAIAEMLKDCDWAYTVAYITEEAYSGAALVSLGCDETIVAKDARLGDIGVIEFDPTLWAFRYADAKARSVFIRQARDIAESKGRSPDLVEAMIDQNVAVYQKKLANGQLEFKRKDIAEGKAPPEKDGDWTLVPESSVGKFLTVNGVQSVELGLATEHASDRDQLKRVLNVDGSLNVQSYNLADATAHFLTNPFVTILLIVVGLVALYIELSAPGIGAGGLIAGLCAVLFFWSRFTGGTSGWLEVLLFVAGITFLLMEIFVIPGWGVSGITGLLLLFISVYMASQNFVLPETPQQWNQTSTTLLVICCSLVIVVISGAFITRKMGSLPVLGRLVLAPIDEDEVPVDPKADPSKTVDSSHPLVSVGDWGVAESVLRPAGRARFGNHSVDVVSEGSFVEPDEQIRVLNIEGNRIVVESVGDSETVYKKS